MFGTVRTVLDAIEWILSTVKEKMALPAAMALSGLNEEHFSDGLNDVFNHGAVLLKSPSASSLASSEGGYSQESGISSMSSETSVLKNLAPYFELLYKTQIELKDPHVDDKLIENSSEAQDKEVLYDGRNILDLTTNIEWNWDFQPAEMRSGIQYFFENRSQYSRVLGAEMPEHIVVTCPIAGCAFNEPQYV